MDEGGTVARMVELVSCFSGLPDHAPLSSCVIENMQERWGTVVLYEQFWS